MIPDFRKKEIIVEKQEKETKLGGGNIKETIGIVKYTGAKAENYKVGDKILFDMVVARLEINCFDKPLLRIENEDLVICRILEDE
jgi:hypothetical protein